MIELAGVRAGQSALDVGCGPGALTTGLVAVLGADSVVAIDPSASFVAANRERNSGVDVRQASAEQLPFDDERFDVALTQLVVHFMADPVAGMREMGRVVRPGGAVAVCVWDLAGARSPLEPFWRVASRRPRRRARHRADGRGRVEYRSFVEWWEPYTLGVGPAGVYVAALDATDRDALRDECRDVLGAPPFTVSAKAWAVRGRVRS
ncbi:MAG: class I SAM-dependent methyltransferase [Actinomycetota bacterium]|nr:class I SAM-dependent methyltransferase [Actinomycetota bacterium]